jgi:hypothetical protein
MELPTGRSGAAAHTCVTGADSMAAHIIPVNTAATSNSPKPQRNRRNVIMGVLSPVMNGRTDTQNGGLEQTFVAHHDCREMGSTIQSTLQKLNQTLAIC